MNVASVTRWQPFIYCAFYESVAMTNDLVLMIWEALGEDRISTAEAAFRLEEAFRYRCPDDLAKTLNKLRKKGLVKGKVDFDSGGWVWWADDECRSAAGEERRWLVLQMTISWRHGAISWGRPVAITSVTTF